MRSKTGLKDASQNQMNHDRVNEESRSECINLHSVKVYQRQRPTRGCAKADDTANMRLSNCSGDKCIQKKTRKNSKSGKTRKEAATAVRCFAL